MPLTIKKINLLGGKKKIPNNQHKNVNLQIFSAKLNQS